MCTQQLVIRISYYGSMMFKSSSCTNGRSWCLSRVRVGVMDCEQKSLQINVANL
jgi:hypothetical protein